MTTETEPSYPLLRQRHSIDIFVCTLVISVILHLAASTFLLLPGRYSLPSSAPLFVDLQSMAVPVESPPEEVRQPVDETLPQQATLSEESTEVAKMEQSIDNSLRRAVDTPEAVHESSIGLGMISGHFASFAEGESLKDDIRVYYFELMRQINEVWWTTGANEGNFVAAASVNIMISRDGKVVGCVILESSGRREQDQALLEAIKKAEPLPPLPQSFRQRTFNAPIRFVPPLRLMFPGFGKKNASPH
jgi:TonB family protein